MSQKGLINSFVVAGPSAYFSVDCISYQMLWKVPPIRICTSPDAFHTNHSLEMDDEHHRQVMC
jgi:hypothetical protein